MINKIIDLYLNIDNAVGVKYYPLSEIFMIIFSEDSDNIADKIAEIDAEIYDLYPDYDHEINYIISENVNAFSKSSVGKFYTK